VAETGANFIPVGFSATNGAVIPIASNTASFSLIGTEFGGDVRSTFALPDLRGRVVIGAGNGAGLSLYFVGETPGVESLYLDGNAPPVDPPPVTGVPEPATFVYVAVFGVALIARKSFGTKKRTR
jgi:microcystin-dependent protein